MVNSSTPRYRAYPRRRLAAYGAAAAALLVAGVGAAAVVGGADDDATRTITRTERIVSTVDRTVTAEPEPEPQTAIDDAAALNDEG